MICASLDRDRETRSSVPSSGQVPGAYDSGSRPPICAWKSHWHRRPDSKVCTPTRSSGQDLTICRGLGGGKNELRTWKTGSTIMGKGNLLNRVRALDIYSSWFHTGTTYLNHLQGLPRPLFGLIGREWFSVKSRCGPLRLVVYCSILDIEE